MKEWFFRWAPLGLFAVGAGIWLVAFLLYNTLGVNVIAFSCMACQLLMSLYCGLIIKKLHRQANTDSLTGMCNRRSFMSKVSMTLKAKFPVSIMMIDIDNFKRINDTYGHLAGDEALKQFAQIIKRNSRNTDIVARLGGEEFAVVLPYTSRENVLKIAERLKQAIDSNDFILGCVTEKMTVSIGLATTKLPIHIDRFLKHADRALYKAKETKNAIVAYEA
ncbi:MAG: GGDEF domain-containing protein [Acetivibrionales bacterium]|jgi:diguanylate cyclase